LGQKFPPDHTAGRPNSTRDDIGPAQAKRAGDDVNPCRADAPYVASFSRFCNGKAWGQAGQNRALPAQSFAPAEAQKVIGCDQPVSTELLQQLPEGAIPCRRTPTGLERRFPNRAS